MLLIKTAKFPFGNLITVRVPVCGSTQCMRHFFRWMCHRQNRQGRRRQYRRRRWSCEVKVVGPNGIPPGWVHHQKHRFSYVLDRRLLPSGQKWRWHLVLDVSGKFIVRNQLSSVFDFKDGQLNLTSLPSLAPYDNGPMLTRNPTYQLDVGINYILRQLRNTT